MYPKHFLMIISTPKETLLQVGIYFFFLMGKMLYKVSWTFVIGKEIQIRIGKMQSDPSVKINKRCTAATQSTLISLSRVKEEDLIVIKVQGQNEAGQLCYWMGRNTPMHNLMLDYCDRTGAVYECTRFRFDGSRINPDRTANDLKMEDGDIIDALSDHEGG